MTQQQISAIQEQARLHVIASEKMQIRDRLEERYREVFAKGFEKLSTTSNVLELLPDCDTDADRLKALIDCTQDGTAPIHDITAAMKTIPEFSECEKLNVEVGKAYKKKCRRCGGRTCSCRYGIVGDQEPHTRRRGNRCHG